MERVEDLSKYFMHINIMIQFKSDCSKDEFKLLKTSLHYEVELVKFDNLTDSLFLLADIVQFCRDQGIEMLQFIKNGAVVGPKFKIDNIDKNYLNYLSNILTYDNLVKENDEDSEWISVHPRRQHRETINKIIRESKKHTVSWSDTAI
jgi:hypothetical protein